ncbi:hypothetical protein A1O7_07892 [Cladophialophora yegresii CBS 114405]|uniref:Beta-xylanase n=1 Tax=Cladophialophora yegresii CBS 114405 TaxID=1182544 RepID=W9WG96_9EURO|nr:uncharacterized protein A1O7_07892 [Cladophialophora yegresii CBS 114405]EXJ57544.1 hypothetical protein A1O7_07892 [Cladophialophora yegresii CBS 114405]
MPSFFTLTAVSALAAVGLATPVAWGPPQGPPQGPPGGNHPSPPWGQPGSGPGKPATSSLAPATTSSAPSTPSTTSSGPSAPSSSCQGYFEPLAAPYLNDLAQAAGKLWFGTATDQPGTGEDTNILYQTILNNTHIFGQITPANAMKFVSTEPEQNVFNYTGGDIDVAIAQDHGKYLRCHNLVWATQISDFVLDGNWSADELTAIMQNHISNVVAHFGGACYSWDVVNEALNSNGTFSPSVWYDTIGPEYFYLAFQFAQEAVDALPAGTPKPKLYYNDYGIEAPGNKSTATENLVKELQARNIRIDGVGLESHFEVGGTPSLEDQIAQKEAYVALGVEVVITELDIRFTQANATNSTGFAQQAQDYYDTVESCMEVDGCVGITVWDFDDQYSWIPSTFPGEGAATLYNADFTRKPAYYAVGDALQGVPCSVCSA